MEEGERAGGEDEGEEGELPPRLGVVEGPVRRERVDVRGRVGARRLGVVGDRRHALRARDDQLHEEALRRRVVRDEILGGGVGGVGAAVEERRERQRGDAAKAVEVEHLELRKLAKEDLGQLQHLRLRRRVLAEQLRDRVALELLHLERWHIHHLALAKQLFQYSPCGYS